MACLSLLNPSNLGTISNSNLHPKHTRPRECILSSLTCQYVHVLEYHSIDWFPLLIGEIVQCMVRVYL